MKRILLFCALVLAGCADGEAVSEFNQKTEFDRKLCIDAGGIPILSSWDGTLKDCIFKPESP